MESPISRLYAAVRRGEGGGGRVLCPDVLFQGQKDSHNRQDRQHQAFQQPFGEQDGQLRPQSAARQSARRGGEGNRQVNFPAAQVLDRGGGAAQAVGDLVGPRRHVDGHAGDEIGGQGDQPAAAGHTVHKPA